MATATTTAPTGAVASLTGFFKDLVNQATPVVSSYLDYRTARENAKSDTVDTRYAAGGSAQRDSSTSGAPASITSAPWFPWAIGAGVLAVGGMILLALRRK